MNSLNFFWKIFGHRELIKSLVKTEEVSKRVILFSCRTQKTGQIIYEFWIRPNTKQFLGRETPFCFVLKSCLLIFFYLNKVRKKLNRKTNINCHWEKKTKSKQNIFGKQFCHVQVWHLKFQKSAWETSNSLQKWDGTQSYLLGRLLIQKSQ